MAPSNLFARMERVFQADTRSGTHELEQLIEEVFDLVEGQVDGIDVNTYRARFREPYPSWNANPLRS